MAVYATPCRVSVCVSQGWWASSVTAVPLDSGSPSAQVSTSGTIIVTNKILLGKQLHLIM